MDPLDELQGAELLASLPAAKADDLQGHLRAPGAEAFQTSPNPPRPRKLTRRCPEPGMGSSPGP